MTLDIKPRTWYSSLNKGLILWIKVLHEDIYVKMIHLSGRHVPLQCLLPRCLETSVDERWTYEEEHRQLPRYTQPPPKSPNITQHSTLFVCLGLTSLFNIWGHVATVPACSSGTLTNVLPHRNAMLQTQDMTPHSVIVYRQGWPVAVLSIEWCGTSHWNTQLPILMSWVRPDREVLSRPSTLTSERSTQWCCYGGSQSEAR